MTPTKVLQKISQWKQILSSVKSIGLPITFHGLKWEDYKNLQSVIGDDAGSVRVSFNCGMLQIMPTSTEHEHYIKLIEQFITVLKMRTRQRISFFGSATMEKGELHKGAEPDACFFVQRAGLVSGKIHFNIAETPPDVVVEIDVHHASSEKFEIYQAFGVSEFWLYDEQLLRIYKLEDGIYQEVKKSAAMPILTATVLTEFLNRSQIIDQTEAVFEFDAWVETQLKQDSSKK